MEMFLAAVVSIALMTISVLMHYQAMIVSRRLLSGSGLSRRLGVLIGMGSVTLAQILSVALYSVAYLSMNRGGMGGLNGAIEGNLLDYFYFSLMSYTTLGVGDIYPSGGVRIVSGLEALNGFALIGWTASFAYTLMQHGWED